MFPAEFVDRFGIPVPKSYTLGTQWVMIADRHPDRYFLGVVAGSSAARLLYESPDANQFQFFVVGTFSHIFMPHALYGSLVNARWFASSSVPGALITVIEGFMPRVRF